MIVFVCSPFRADSAIGRRAHVEVALDVCRLLVEAGHVPVAPHLLYPRFLDDEVPEDRELGIRCGLALLERCDAMLVHTIGDAPSEGMEAEVRFARARGIPIVSDIASLPR